MSTEAVANIVATAAVETNTHTGDGNDTSGMVWYLGYGANMSSKVLSGRRQVFPVESHPVVVPGYQLTFDMVGLPYWEPGFGTIVPVNGSNGSAEDRALLGATRMFDCQAGSPLHCIAHLITKKELDHIVNTEGGNGSRDFGYQLIEIACETYDGRAISGISLIDAHTSACGYHPSTRYHKIIVDGAEEHGLDAKYIERLKMIKPYVAATVGQIIAKHLTLVIGAPLIFPLVVCMFASLAFKTKVPQVVSVYGEWIKRLVWVLHDWVLAPVFGKGH
ncbi:hypothetical protein LPJ66_002120 [Kickxella alabastrina]|uniref:Uncharacterized protein n=1 Tax=Kickxella alabastrina TaxID=61397 RepID=A0ACC1IRA3_9FUNG|nr:hypothetical protein LPJ66_002120 [Kickxella alabastrina]